MERFLARPDPVRAVLTRQRASLREVRFSLEVVNGGDWPLLATVYAVVRDGNEIPIAPYCFWIDAHTNGRIELPLPWLAAFSTRALAVRLQSPAVHQRLEAEMRRPWGLLWFAAALVVMLLSLGTVAVVLASRAPVSSAAVTPQPTPAPPRIIAFSLDRAAVSDGGTITARYRISGDDGDLVAVDAQGGIVAQAAVHDGEGTRALHLPRFGRARDLQIRLVVRRGSQLVAAGLGIETVAP